MNIQSQSKIYWDHLVSRKRSPIKPTTAKIYQSYLNKWILPELGSLEVSAVENGVMKVFVSKLATAGLSASAIEGVTGRLKDIVSSAIDVNGNELYPRKWNSEFVDAPIIDPAKQKAPTITLKSLQEALGRAQGQFRALYALLAGSGLRMSESLALQPGPDDGKGSFWLPEQSKLVVRQQRKDGILQSPKTQAGIREVDLAPELNAFLCNETPRLKGFCDNNYLFDNRRLVQARQHDGVPGYHSFRRFRRTHLESQNVPRGLSDFWMGHAGKEVSDRYIKIGQDIEARKTWCAKAGLGFELGFGGWDDQD
jgi:hypothetical protein